jgi:hypothetical protein
MFHRQRAHGGWTSARELFRQDIAPQYTHHYGHIACHASGAVFAGCHFYNVGGRGNHPVTGDKSRMRSYGMAVLRSDDLGETWTDLSGRPVATPTLYHHAIAVPPVDEDLRLTGLEVDRAGGVWVLVTHPGVRDGRVLLQHWTGRTWETQSLERHLPAGWAAVDGALAIDAADGLHVALSAVRAEAVGDGWAWGHASSEVFHLASADAGRSWRIAMASEPDERVANWLPTLSRGGPWHPVDRPVLLYTHGEPGQGCTPVTTTEVWCVML